MMELGSRGGPLHMKYLVYLDRVAIAAYPENYEDRLTEMFPGSFEHLRLMALDPYDLALSKLERNSQKDRDDNRRSNCRRRPRGCRGGGTGAESPSACFPPR